MVLESWIVGDNSTQEHTEEEGYAMETLFKHHNITMAVACFSSLTLGLLLVINMLTQLKARSYLHFAYVLEGSSVLRRMCVAAWEHIL